MAYLYQPSPYLFTLKAKTNLDSVYRKPYFHFIVDVSESQALKSYWYQSKIQELLNTYPDLAPGAKISLCDAYQNTLAIDANWSKAIEEHKASGGFFLDKTLRSILSRHYLQNEHTYPVLVVVGNKIAEAIKEVHYKDLAFTYPESDLLYFQGPEASLQSYSLSSNTSLALDETEGFSARPVLQWTDPNNQVHYLAPNTKPELSFSPNQDIYALIKEDYNPLEKAFIQEALWRQLVLFPKDYPTHWQLLLKSSFESGIMTPVSSYIVLENEAQKEVLLKKQKLVGKSNSNLDLEEKAPNSMSEPGFLLLLSMLWLGWRLRRKKSLF